MDQNTPVAITGMGCLCAAGMNIPDCMDSIFKGKRNADTPVAFSTSHSTSYPVFEIKEDIPNVISEKKSGPGIFRTSELILAATHEALNNASLNEKMLHGKRVGVCIGTSVGSAMNNEPFYVDYRNGGYPEMEPIHRFLNSNPASCIARKYHFSGPCQTIVNACSSGTDAIGIGMSWIKSGICDVVIAGGADEISRTTYNGFISLMIVDHSLSRPFDATRSGLNLGEGGAVLVLESKEMINSRGKQAELFVRGYGSACDAYHITAPRPDGKGLKSALSYALKSSGKTVSDIAFINAHGTGTPDNDKVESRVLRDIFPDICFHSTKGYTGHTLGAAGAIEAVFAATCLEMGKTPISAGFSTMDPKLKVSPQQKIKPVNGSIAISESLAFGGNNSVLVIGKGDGH